LLAKSEAYPQNPKNCRYDLHMYQEPLWGNDFRYLGFKEIRLLAGKND
jgi:hypothetical protein